MGSEKLKQKNQSWLLSDKDDDVEGGNNDIINTSSNQQQQKKRSNSFDVTNSGNKSRQ